MGMVAKFISHHFEAMVETIVEPFQDVLGGAGFCPPTVWGGLHIPFGGNRDWVSF